MSLTIRKATKQDAKELLVTINEAHQFKLSRGDAAWETEPFTSEEILASIESDNTYIVFQNDQPVGTVGLTWEDQHTWGAAGSDGKAGYIHRLATRDAYRGQQIGQKVITWVHAQISEAGRVYVRLDCPADNKELCAYYEKQGFRRVRVQKTGGYMAALYEKSPSRKEGPFLVLVKH